jgi:beta-fructofuranosidase
MTEEDAFKIRQKLLADPYRPLYHFLPPWHWMNDPNGLIEWKGLYHLFYQHNPDSYAWGNIHWGHAVSKDLFHWKDYPIALSPTPGSWDESGCWSGCAINFHHIPALMYTARNGENEYVCMATSQDDDLRTWQKHPRNPVYVLPPTGEALSGFRDPFVWQDGLNWYLIIGSGYPGKGGVIFLYTSIDLIRWELVGTLFEDDNLNYGDMWECPNLLRIGHQYLLLISEMSQRRVIYFTGDFQAGKFNPKTQGVFDAGGSYYAPLGFYDSKGRVIIFGWSSEGRSDEAQRAAGWAGVQALPRQLSITEAGILNVEPVAEVESIRGKQYEMGQVCIYDGDDVVLPFSGDCLELSLAAHVNQSDWGVRILCAPDKSEYTVIGYDAKLGEIYLDRARLSTSPTTKKDRHAVKIDLLKNESLRLRIFIDRSIVEVFANQRWCLTSRVYPVNRESLLVSLFSTRNETVFNEVRGCCMERIWPN